MTPAGSPRPQEAGPGLPALSDLRMGELVAEYGGVLFEVDAVRRQRGSYERGLERCSEGQAAAKRPHSVRSLRHLGELRREAEFPEGVEGYTVREIEALDARERHLERRSQETLRTLASEGMPLSLPVAEADGEGYVALDREGSGPLRLDRLPPGAVEVAGEDATLEELRGAAERIDRYRSASVPSRILAWCDPAMWTVLAGMLVFSALATAALVPIIAVTGWGPYARADGVALLVPAVLVSLVAAVGVVECLNETNGAGHMLLKPPGGTRRLSLPPPGWGKQGGGEDPSRSKGRP